MLTDDRECETCKGVGTIDMRLGGEWNSDPNSECPDCEGSGRIATRAIEAEVLQTQEPAGEIVMYAPYGKLSAPFARPEWRGGALPPVGTKLYTTPQPPAPCPKCAENAAFRLLAVEHANVTANEALGYQKSIRDLQAKVADLTRDVAQWKNNHATVVAQARILKERTDMPIERVNAYENWQKVTAERDALALQNKALEKEVENWSADFIRISDNYSEEAKMNMDFGAERLAFILKEQKQYTLIEQCEQALKNENALQRGYQYRGGVPIRSIAAEALAAIASHKKGGSE